MYRTTSTLLTLGLALNGSLYAQDDDRVVELEEVSLQATQDYMDDSALIADAVSSSSKLGGSLLETPRSVSVITMGQIEERGALSIQDALDYTPGVRTGGYGFDSRLDSAQIRGVSPLAYLDGFQSIFKWYNSPRIDVFMLERVEVVKGPSSVLYGQSALGGIVNSVSKTPKAEQQGLLEVQYGNNERKQIAADVTGPIDEQGQFLYRVVGLFRDSDTDVDYVSNDSKAIMPSFTWAPTDATELTLLVSLQENHRGQSLQFLPTEGTLEPGRHIPSDTFIGEPDWDRYDTEHQSYSLFFDHTFNDVFSFEVNSRYLESDAIYRAHWVAYTGGDLIDDDGNIIRTAYDARNWTRTFVGNAIGHADFDTGMVSHQVSAGLDWQDVTTDSDYAYGSSTINIYDPVYGQEVVTDPIADMPETDNTVFGAYARDRISYGNWLLSAGIRRDSVETQDAGTDEPSIDQWATTGDVGLMYIFDFGLSVYGSWAESFEAQGKTEGFDGSQIQLDPKEGRQYEVGLKYQPQNINALFTVALYDIEETNRPVQNGLVVEQTSTDIQGIELAAQTNLDDWYFTAGYTYLEAEDVNGHQLVTIPKHAASTWVSYKPSTGPLANFKAGAGLRYTGETWDGADAASTDDVLLVDAMIGYDFEPFSVQLNARNLEDKEYVASTDGRAYYGQRRSVVLTAKYHF